MGQKNCQEYEKWGATVKVIPACWGGVPPNPQNMPYNSAMMERMWVPTDYQTSGDSNYDWAVIKLNENKGNETGFCDIESNDTSSELKNVEVFSKGYPNPTGNNTIMPYKATGKILNAYGMRFYTDMDIEHGQSGSPVFKKSNETNVIGIVSSEDMWNHERNVVTKINTSVKSATFQIRFEAQQ